MMNGYQRVRGASELHEADERQTALAQFEEQRPLLFGIAYRMLGSVMEAEDLVQEAYLRFQAVPLAEIRSPRSFLITVVTRLCLDQLKSARAQRERYIGPWLPEPVLTGESDGWRTPGHRLDAYESISMAFLVLLETLTPLERAVFLLREVFEFSYPEVAGILGRSEEACRQVFHRAKRALTERRPRFQSTPEAGERLAHGFVRAVEAGDLDELMHLLADDITLWADGGGKVALAAVRPLHGAEAAARFLVGTARRTPPVSYRVAEINGEPAVLVELDPSGEIEGVPRLVVAVLETDGSRIRNLRIVGNPDKLQHLP